MDPLQTIQPASNPNRYSETPTPGKKRSPLFWTCLGALALVIVCIVLVGGFGGGYFLASSLGLQPLNQPENQQSSQPEEAPSTAQTSFTEMQTLAVNPDGKMQTDEKGVGLQVSPVEGKTGQPVELISSQPGKEFEKALQGNYSVESLAYSLSADGAGDTSRRGSLVFPSKSPEDRVAVVVDQKYVGILSVTPEDGKLTITSKVSLPGGSEEFSPSGVDPKATQYLVVHPLTGSFNPPENRVDFAYAGGWLQSQRHDDLVSCADWYHNYCWSNKEASIYIFFDKKTNLSYPFLDLMAASTEALNKYKELGFTRANVSKSNPLYIVVGGDEAPAYSSKTGNLYVPLDILSKSNEPATKYAIAHELFHWTEDESYVMTADALSGINSWWLEVAAENAAFMVNTSSINDNLKEYGRASTNNVLGFQLTPFTWARGEEARYIQAQNLLVSLCDGGAGCAVSQEAMISAINNGSNPFSDSSVQQRYQENSADVARYLMGMAPQQSNSGVTIPAAAKSGKMIGDFIHGKKKGTGTDFVTSNYPPTFQKGQGNVVVTAAIPAGGVYPLRVSNGANGPDEEIKNLAGAPLYLQVDAGQDYWAKAGTTEAFDASGKGQLMIGPIHDKLGFDSVRVVSYAKSQPTEFKASVAIINLSGDWVGKDLKLVSQQQSCPSEDGGDSGVTLQATDTILNLLSAYGQFVKDPADASGATLKWEQSEPIPDAGNTTIEAQVVVGSENIKLTLQIDIPKSTSSLFSRQFVFIEPRDEKGETPLSWIWITLPGMAMVVYIPRKNRRTSLLITLMIFALLIPVFTSGCGIKNIYGKIDGEYTFTKIEYPEKDFSYPAKGDVYWNLSDGSANMKIDIFSESYIDLLDESKGTEEKECITTVSYTLSGVVQKDGLVTADSLKSSSE